MNELKNEEIKFNTICEEWLALVKESSFRLLLFLTFSILWFLLLLISISSLSFSSIFCLSLYIFKYIFF